jgi:very-short-patch-repair endonuclease
MAALAARQHGVVGYWQLVRLGFTPTMIRRRVESGRLHRIHHAVFAVGHRRLTRKGRWMAAVLACGPEAVLSHRAAAALWELPTGGGGTIDVTVPGTRKGRTGIRVHRVRRLDRAECTLIDNIPVTSLARTLLDLAEIETAQRLRTLLEASERLDRFDYKRIEDVLARSRGRRGIKPLRAVLAQLRGPPPETRSHLERRFLELIRAAGLPEPSVNVVVLGDVVDFYWPREKLIVETDGYHFHKTRRTFEEDRARDAKRQVAGLAVIRPTHARLEHEAAHVLEQVDALLRRRRRVA